MTDDIVFFVFVSFFFWVDERHDEIIGSTFVSCLKISSAAHSLCGPSGRGPLQLAWRWTTPVSASYWSINDTRAPFLLLPTAIGFFGLLAKLHAFEKCFASVGLSHVLESSNNRTAQSARVIC